MELPWAEIIAGICALGAATIAGTLAIINTKVSRRVQKVEKAKNTNELLTVENNILEQLLPVFERKDEALDKIADILHNVLECQDLTQKQVESMNLILRNRCQAMDLIQRIIDNQENAQNVEKSINELVQELSDPKNVEGGEN